MCPAVRWAFALGVVAVSAAACGRSGALDPLRGDGIPTPGFPDPGEETPTPTPQGLALPFGDGHDGALAAGVATVVNQCAALVTGSNDSVTLATMPIAMTAGTVILAWQVQDDFAASTGSEADITNAASAGTWELTRIAAVSGNTLTVFPPLGGAYVSGGSLRAQACNVPEYTNVTIASGNRIAGIPWSVGPDGGAGGVVAFFASGTVSVDGRIDVSSMGFRGGAPSGMSGNTNFGNLDSSSNMDGGGKGEALDSRGVGLFARGNCGNGGGGGNAGRAGGGGGGNGGAGGYGGQENSADGNDDASRGFPGARVVVPGDRLLPGGGGGGGHRSTAANARGGNGGGVILLMVNVLTGSGVFAANGEDGFPTTPAADGAGGGGAGGMVDLRFADGGSFDGDIEADGGDGASNLQGGGGQRYGPGGGGGGGIVRLSGSVGGGAIDVDGGDRGNADNGDPRNAENGSSGVIEQP